MTPDPSDGFKLEAVFSHGTSRYVLLSNTEGLTYSQAEAEAARFGGALASLETTAENDAVFAQVNQHDTLWTNASLTRQMGPWIGGARTEDDQFEWESGAPFVVTHWASSEPNDYGGNETRVHYLSKTTATAREATWNDLPESGLWPFGRTLQVTGLVIEIEDAASDNPAPSPYRVPVGTGTETAASDGDGYYIAGGGFMNGKSNGAYHSAEDWNGDIGPGENGDSDEGDPIYTFGAGQIVVQTDYASRPDLPLNYGKTVIVDHTESDAATVRLFSLYTHLEKNDYFEQGAEIGQNARIGDLGGTGDDFANNKYLAHLHFAVFESTTYAYGIFGINGLGGAEITQAELNAAQSVIRDDAGNIVSVVLSPEETGNEQFVRYFSSHHFIDQSGNAERIYDVTKENEISVTTRTGAVSYELFGLSGRDRIQAGSLDDLISGGSQADKLFGYGGADMLYGDAGKDRLVAGRGKDILDGGSGNDTLLGKKGHDRFVFSDGTDKVIDFDTSTNREKIDLTGVATITDFKDLKASHLSMKKGSAHIDDGNGNSMTLIDIDIADLSRGDFLFQA